MKTKLKKILLIFSLFLCLGTATLSVNAAGRTTKTKAVYTLKTYRKIYKNAPANATGTYKFVLPQLKGKTSVVKRINKSLKQIYRASLQDKADIMETTKSLTPGQFSWKSEFFSKTTCKVTYNKKGVVSFCFCNDWFAGGVHNMYHYGASYSLKTGKKLELTDVIAGSEAQIRSKIADKYYAKLGNFYASRDELQNEFSSRSSSSLYFYLKNGKVYVSCGSYGPLGGNGEVLISLKGNY